MNKSLNNEIRRAIAIVILETVWNLTRIAEEIDVSKATLSRIYNNKTDFMETQSYLRLMAFLEKELKNCSTPFIPLLNMFEVDNIIITADDPRNPMFDFNKQTAENEQTKLDKKLEEKSFKLEEAKKLIKEQVKEIKRMKKIMNKIGGLIGDDLIKFIQEKD